MTISGDTAFEYESEQVYEKSNNSTSVSKEQNREKYEKTFKEIEMENDAEAPATKIVAKAATRSKSILKNNKKESIFVNEVAEKKEDSYGGRESRFVDKIKDIDGKIITSNRSIGSEKGVREVEFRKSLFASQEKPFASVMVPNANLAVPKAAEKKGGRKSCLKRSSF